MGQVCDRLFYLSVHRCGDRLVGIPIFTLKTIIAMKVNVGSTDKIIRLLLAAVFAVLFFTGMVSGVLGYVLLALGAIFVLTSLIGFCPIYALVGLNTCPAKKS